MNIPLTHTKLEHYIAIFVSINAIVQFIADAIVEGLKLVPTRVNHLGLTLLNAFVSFKTLSAIKKNKFRFLHEDIQTLFLLEVLLIFGDVFYILDEGWDEQFFYIRLGFVGLSIFNLCFATYIIVRYELWHMTYQGPSAPTRHPSVLRNNSAPSVPESHEPRRHISEPVRHISAPSEIEEIDLYIDENQIKGSVIE